MTNKNTYQKTLSLCFDKIYPKLNDMQRKAVTTVNGPLLVLAGAGSGKTTVLVNRIYHIMNFGSLCEAELTPEECEKQMPLLQSALNGTKQEAEEALRSVAVKPAKAGNVLCITFTNKAAGEFKERLASLLGGDANDIWAGTFHSICVRILRRNINLIGFSNSFTIYDTDDCKRVVTKLLKDKNIDDKMLSPKTVCAAISSFKEQRIMPEEAEREAVDFRQKSIADIYSDYMEYLKEASALDFDDLILNTIVLFETHPDILNYYSSKFRYILVDEYQDTNPSQNDLVIMLGGVHKNVCVVGDDDQSIYSFRGATVENILNFDRSFEDLKTIKLEQNYRSTKTILDAANAVIAHNKGRKGKELWTNGAKGEKITAVCRYTQNEEAEYIVNEISKLHAYGRPLNEIAVLYRMNSISNALEASLIKNRIPYKVYGGMRFNERKEIKDIVAYLSLISNSADNVRLRRIINLPKRQIGDTTVDTLGVIAEQRNISMLEVCRLSSCFSVLARASARLEKFYTLIAELTEYAKTHKISELISRVIVQTGYEQMLLDENEKDRLEVVREFISTGVSYEESVEAPTLEGFLSDMALASDTDDYDESVGNVSLMTVHSAKGLEFPVVFIAGFEEGIFPSAMAIKEGGTEEERRLSYVAITRAKEKLYITYTKSRTLYGMTAPSVISEFFNEIPEELMDMTLTRQKDGFVNGSGSRDRGYQRTYQPSPKPQFKDFAVRTSPKPQKPSGYSKGQRVKHKFFGEGVVLSCENMGNDALVEVSFDSGSVKKLMASFAKLEKI